jgi:uncharacterized protein YndB with AHSA1/START domain
MPEVLLEAPIQAPAERVYAAITEQSGLSRWWTPSVGAEPRVGSIAEFQFRGGAFVVKMEITELDTNRRVGWAVRQGSPEWADTHVSWELIPMDGGTRVRFGHHNYASVEGSFANVTFNWAYYLNSLKDYLEMGQGRPGGLHS